MLWNFFARKSATPAHSPRPQRARLEVEHLHERVLPSTSPVLLDARPAASHAATNHSSAGRAHQRLNFALTGTAAAKGRAEVQVVNGKLTKLSLHIQRAEAGKTLSVTVDGTTVGTIRTNSGGSGKLLKARLNLDVQNPSEVKVLDADGNVVMAGRFRVRAPRG